ncbi:MAG: hypothetical protein AVDCRST_MAG67-1317 [uncultured Solirubrobacteraceae bacterium]|uniref:Uncharacterized protein n=1 Tax=uncultured Solirubrobacteraceae bacterium TaxID=1162706 RepID=A0A6J4S630_9ACTN|nr:MAG: hypothetical protein AVDCRST_MAG67-1317 [uncultured Solirubrobacteraceae bacterium]
MPRRSAAVTVGATDLVGPGLSLRSLAARAQERQVQPIARPLEAEGESG